MAFTQLVSQCAIPAFEGLLPRPHNKRVMTLLYRFAEWHALAKLRMHTDPTLAQLQGTTTKFCTELRRFRDETCCAFKTVELPKERRTRQRRQKGTETTAPTEPSSKIRGFNMNTYKFHAIADYARTIIEFGSTDSYTTQIVSRDVIGYNMA
ncbi:hypothetical protein BV22DRAFT_1027095 [Leucogyrophana mollusca]|uniref:Uncharacterized protein n=1 Tax=Leucogyrophana mollusca TaxID=85980 RepID=A0ACB8AVF8_9AGAM|nr:hypothetical protein BV22DRAFT_1027095 [Leucogyrophana mollusca]